MRFVCIILISLMAFTTGCKIEADSGDANGKNGPDINITNQYSPDRDYLAQLYSGCETARVAWASEGARAMSPGSREKVQDDSHQPSDKFGKKKAELSGADAKSGRIFRETAQLENQLRVLKERRNQFSPAIEKMEKLYARYRESPSTSRISELGKNVSEFFSDRELLLAETGNLDGQISAIESRLPALKSVQRIIALQSARAKATLDREAVEYKMQQLLVEAGEAIEACEKVSNSGPVPIGKDQTKMLAIAERVARVEGFRAQLVGE